MTAGFLSGPTVANITDTTVSVSGMVATYTLPVWSTIPDQTDDALSLPLTLDLTAYVTSQTPITAWGTDVGTVDANGILTIPAGTLAGANVITVSATNSAGEASAAPFTWTVTYQEYFKDFSLSDNTGWTHTRGSEAWMHDYLGNIVTVNGTDADDEAFAGSQYTDPDTYVDHGVGYGIQLEAESTNDLLHSNDLSNAAWTLTNATLTTDVVTATAANGTVTQTVTAASGGHTFSVYVYPVAVTGAIEISAGNGVWVAVTPGEATRFDTTQTATNPVVGVRIVNSGDSVRVRYAQLEVGKSFSSSYIATVAAPVTRASTKLAAPFSALSPLPAGGVVNDFCGQYVFRAMHDQAEGPSSSLPRVFTIANRSTSSNNLLQVYAYPDGRVVLAVQRQSSSSTVTITLTEPYITGQVVDLRYRKSATTGIDFWIIVDGVLIDTLNNASIIPYDEPLKHVVPGAWYNGTRVQTQEHTLFRIIPAALSNEDIVAWDTWTEPRPIITQQPSDIDFGGVGPSPGPTFTLEPVNASVNEPEGINFLVQIDGIEELYPTTDVSWECNKSGDWRGVRSDFPSVVGENYIACGIPISAVGDDCSFRCVATNSEGTRYSNEVTLTVEPKQSQSQTPGLIYEEHISYVGSFSVPNNGTGQNASYGGNALTFAEDGSGLYIGAMGPGNYLRSEVGKINIPAVGGNATWLINSTPFLYDRTYGHGYSNSNEYVRGGLNYNGRLIFLPCIWYDNNYWEGYTAFTATEDLSSFSSNPNNGTGMYTADYASHPELTGKTFVNGGMCLVPSAWQAALGGWPALCGNGDMSIKSGGVQGHSICGFNPDDIGVTNPYPIEPFVSHTHTNPLMPKDGQQYGPDGLARRPEPAPNEIFNYGDDSLVGMCWPEGTDTVLVLSMHGTGVNTYEVADYCTSDKGDYSKPNRMQLLGYDANDFIRVKNNEIEPHQVQPYTVIVLHDDVQWPCLKGEPGGFAYDPTNKRIYFCNGQWDGQEVFMLDVGELT